VEVEVLLVLLLVLVIDQRLASLLILLIVLVLVPLHRRLNRYQHLSLQSQLPPRHLSSQGLHRIRSETIVTRLMRHPSPNLTNILLVIQIKTRLLPDLDQRHMLHPQVIILHLAVYTLADHLSLHSSH
jgi:hypothetical protein